MQGWIKDHRKELLSDIWLMPPLYHRVWQYLKYKVNHKPREYPTPEGRVLVDTGETITSLRHIAEAVKWIEYGVERVPSPKTIRVILDWLEGEKMIARESNRRGTRIKVLNYSVYQGGDNGESNTKETPRKHCLPTNKNVKNYKNDKEDLIYVLTADEERFLSVLSKIENYPLDRKRDLELYRTMAERYPELDLVAAIEQWATYKLDKPLAENANPRSQINTAFKKYLEWGKCLKERSVKSGAPERHPTGRDPAGKYRRFVKS